MLEPEQVEPHIPNSVIIDPESGYAINVPAVVQQPMFWWEDRPDVFERIQQQRAERGIEVVDFPDGKPERTEDDGLAQGVGPLDIFEQQQAELRDRDPAKADRRESRRPLIVAAQAAWDQRQDAAARENDKVRLQAESTTEPTKKPVRRTGD